VSRTSAPTCLVFAASDAHAAARPGWEPLSAEWAYYHAVKRDGGHPDEGATLRSMLATIKSEGQPGEHEWPYIKAPITDIKSWKPPAPARQLFFRDHATCTLTVQTVIDQLDAQCPVLLTMTLRMPSSVRRPTASLTETSRQIRSGATLLSPLDTARTGQTPLC
jgi:hypothetical protein